MMMPSMSPSSSSHPGAVSSSSAIVRVEKATSEFLIGPDWTMNIDICDTLNSNQWLAKDVVKAVKKRLLHKNAKVQLLALTLLETMVKNCGDYVHFQIVDRNILQEMVKIVKKKTDMHVRDKILVLLDSWQEAFGGPGGKYPQYYWAFEELRRMGVGFPQRSLDTAPIFTPPMTHPPIRHPQPGYGMPNNSSTRLDEAMAAEMETLSLSSISSMRNVLDLLADMLQAANPTDRLAVKDEVIIDLVERCRANQKKLMQMLTTTGDEELLAQGLELNDNHQTVLAKHDAIASGLPLPIHTNFSLQSNDKDDSSLKPADAATPSRTSNGDPLALVPITRSQIDEEEEEEDDFALLARRHSKMHSSASQAASVQNSEGDATLSHVSNTNTQESSSTMVINNALVLADPPAPFRTTKEQDIIDLLSITLSTSTSPQTAQVPTPPKQNFHEGTAPSGEDNNSVASQAYLGNQTQAFNSYVAPWALPQQQFQPSPQGEQLVQNPEKLLSQQYPQYYGQVEPQSQVQPLARPTPSQYAYPPPPWAATPGYFSNPNPVSRPPYTYSSSQAASLIPSQGTRTSQHLNPPPVTGSSVSALNGDARVGNGNTAPGGQKPFIPSYRLFEDLNVLGHSTDGRMKPASNSSSLSGTQNRGMVGGGK